MSKKQDMLIWKLQKDLARAHLALFRIKIITDKVYCLETKHATSFIGRDDVDKIVETIKEFFNDDKGN